MLQGYGEILMSGKDEKQARAEIEQYAQNAPGGPDQFMLQTLQNQGLAGVRKLLDERHNLWLSNTLSAAQLAKSNSALTADQAYMPGGGTGAGGGGMGSCTSKAGWLWW